MPSPIPHEKSAGTHARYFVLLWLCLAATLAYIHRNSMGVAEAAMRADLKLSKEEMGQAMGAFFISYALLQVPAGWLANVWGTRRALATYCAAWSVCTAGMALSQGLWTLFAARLAQGAAQAGVFSCSTSSVATWFPVSRRALANGVVGGFMSVGGAIGVTLTGLCLTPLGWQGVFALFAVPGIVWAVWFFVWFRDRPQEHASVDSAELALIHGGRDDAALSPSHESPAPTPWRGILLSPATVCICGQQLFRGAGNIFYASWFTTFLRESRHVSLEEAGVLTSLPLWAVVPGSLLGGWLSDWLMHRTGSRRISRKWLAAISLSLCAVCILAARPIAEAWTAVLIISVGSLFASCAGPCAYTITIDMGGRHVATVFSVMNMAGNVGAWMFPVMVPWLVGTGSTEVTEDWDRVLFLFAGMYAAAAVCWLLLNPEGTVYHRQSGRSSAVSDVEHIAPS